LEGIGREDDIEVLEGFDIKSATIEGLNKYFGSLKSLTKKYSSMGAVYITNPVYIRLKKLLFPTFEFLCAKFPENVIDKHQDSSCWSMVYKEISTVDIKKDGIDEATIQDYLEMCNEVINGFVSCYNAIKDTYKPLDTSLNPSNKIRRLAANLLVYIGDLMRYKMKAAKKAKALIDPSKAQDEVLRSYMEAKSLYPFEGKIYNQIAVTLVVAGNSLGCMYYFMRCVFCEYPFTLAMESLIKHFEKISIRYADIARVWSKPSASKSSSKSKHIEEQLKNISEEFWISFLRFIGIVFNKIDCDKCKEVLANVKAKLKVYLDLLNSIKDLNKRKNHVEQLSNTIIFLIFAVHYSVLGPIDKSAIDGNKKKYNNEQALVNDTGLISLNALTDITEQLISVISPNNEETYSIIIPVCYWLTSHSELREHIWNKHKRIKKSLSSVYRVLMKIDFKGEVINHVNEMIEDDYRFIGFVPFDDVILKKKSIKVEESKENKVRMALLKELLSKMDCEVTEPEQPEEIKLMPTRDFFEGESEVYKIHNQISEANIKIGKPLIVVDVQNIAMKYGNGTFVCKGIEITLEFWKNRKHKVVGFIPDYLINDREIQRLIRLKEENPTAVKASKVPDDINYLKRLHKEGIIVTTPSQDYDDSYSIEYAKKHKGYIVTNDKFRDHVNKSADKLAESNWIKLNRIGFAFKGDEFLPNPDAEFFKIYGEDD